MVKQRRYVWCSSGKINMVGETAIEKYNQSASKATHKKCVPWSCVIIVAAGAAAATLCYSAGHHVNNLHSIYRCIAEESECIIEFMNFYWDVLTENNLQDVRTDIYTDGKKRQGTHHVVTVEALFKPFKMSTMTFKDEIANNFQRTVTDDRFDGLKSWRKPHHQWLNFDVENFTVFKPPTTANNTIGQVYEIVELKTMKENEDNTQLTSHRHSPLPVEKKYLTIHRLLSMFHPNLFIVTRFLPRGGVAVVRARNEKYLEIVFRIHAEYQLNKSPNVPFWFTPAQFTGTLVVSKDFKRLRYFTMYVPTHRRLNVGEYRWYKLFFQNLVFTAWDKLWIRWFGRTQTRLSIDIEWMDGTAGMQADIGYIREMSLETTSPSVPTSRVNKDERLPRRNVTRENIAWSEEISISEANTLMELEMYPFKQVLTQKTLSKPLLSKAAMRLLKYFEFPVTMLLAKPDGTVVHKMALNEFFLTLRKEPEERLKMMTDEIYGNFLRKGLSIFSRDK